MSKKIDIKKTKLFKVNTLIIATTIITLLLGIADMTLDILHTKGNVIGTWFLILGIVMSIPGLTWLIASIVLVAKDKQSKIVKQKTKATMIFFCVIAFCAFVPLWIEGFIDGNGLPMFERAMYRQVIWMIVWIIYLLTNLIMFSIAYGNRCRCLHSK